MEVVGAHAGLEVDGRRGDQRPAQHLLQVPLATEPQPPKMTIQLRQQVYMCLSLDPGWTDLRQVTVEDVRRRWPVRTRRSSLSDVG